METLWLSPTGYVTGDPTLQISYPFVSHPGTVVTCVTPGDFKWISMGLPLLSSRSIKEVSICYQLTNPQNFISQIRLAQMTTPNQAVVQHDDGTDLTNTTPSCYTSIVGGFFPAGAVTLALRLNFQNTTDQIMLGAVSIGLEDLT